MILHKKSHLGTPMPSAATASTSAAAKTAQKRLSSPVKKVVPNKKSKKVEQDESGDLFDQVKRNLEESSPNKEESSVKQPRKKQRQTPAKATKVSSTAPTTPKTPRTPKTTTPKSTSKVSNVPAKVTDKTQLNPKKKWLKSSLQKEENPEVKMKLMADWEEDEEEQQLRKEAALKKEAEAAVAAVAAAVTKEVQPESDSDQDLPAKSNLLQHRSDDEDDTDYPMETDKPVTKPAEADTDAVGPPPAPTAAPPPATVSESLVEAESTTNMPRRM